MSENWITLISFLYPQEAYLAKNVLEVEDIPVFLKDELTVQVNNFYSNAVGGVKLIVRESDKEKALTILREAGYIKETSEKSRLEIFSETYTRLCPYCNSENINRTKQPGLLFLVSVFTFGAPLPFLKKKYHCFDCGKEWRVG